MTTKTKPGRRSLLVGTAAAIALTAGLSLPTDAQTRAPSGPIELVLGTNVGGTPDVIMRQATRILNDAGLTDLTFVIQNRTGGSWAVSANYMLEQTGNESVIYTVAQPVWTTPITQGLQTFYDRLTPIAIFVQGDLIVVGRADAPEQTLAEYVERARNDPGGVSFSGSQMGSTDSIAAALVEEGAGVEFNYVPYSGGSEAMAAFLGGNVDLTVLAVNEAMEMMEANLVVPLAILTAERRTEPELADIPTARELGFDAVWSQTWGVAGPPGMDPELARWWSELFEQLVASPEWTAARGENFWRADFIGVDDAPAAFERIHQDHLDVLRDLGLSQM